DGLAGSSTLKGTPRHFFWLKLADAPNCPSIGFTYTEIDPQRNDRAAVLELTLPATHPPGELAAIASRLTGLGSLHAMVGGYAGRWNWLQQRLAFNQLYRWAQRYPGLDIQDPEAMAVHAPGGLPGS